MAGTAQGPEQIQDGRVDSLIAKRSSSDVVITGRRRDVLERTASEIGVQSVVCDDTRPADLERLAEVCGAGVSVLVNNAGGNSDIGSTEPTSLGEIADGWMANVTSNLLTAVLTTSALEPLLDDDARIVNVGSIAADTGAGSYGAAKAAVQSWTNDLAARLGPRGITVNSVSPGYIEGTEFFGGALSSERREQLRAATLLKRVGRPDDVANTVAFLASADARHITAQNIHVNGGAFRSR